MSNTNFRASRTYNKWTPIQVSTLIEVRASGGSIQEIVDALCALGAERNYHQVARKITRLKREGKIHAEQNRQNDE